MDTSLKSKGNLLAFDLFFLSKKFTEVLYFLMTSITSATVILNGVVNIRKDNIICQSKLCYKS